MLAGIRRLFTLLAIIWFVVAFWVLLNSPIDKYRSENSANILIEVAVLYGIGWAITFVFGGFRDIRNPIRPWIADAVASWKRDTTELSRRAVAQESNKDLTYRRLD